MENMLATTVVAATVQQKYHQLPEARMSAMSRTPRSLLIALLILGCSQTPVDASGGLNDVDVGLPNRTHSADVSRVSSKIRSHGGNVFVKLTGEPTALAITVLGLAGLMAPRVPNPPLGIVRFDGLKIATVWGWASPGMAGRIAALKFVIRVESSADPDEIAAAIWSSDVLALTPFGYRSAKLPMIDAKKSIHQVIDGRKSTLQSIAQTSSELN